MHIMNKHCGAEPKHRENHVRTSCFAAGWPRSPPLCTASCTEFRSQSSCAPIFSAAALQHRQCPANRQLQYVHWTGQARTPCKRYRSLSVRTAVSTWWLFTTTTCRNTGALNHEQRLLCLQCGVSARWRLSTIGHGSCRSMHQTDIVRNAAGQAQSIHQTLLLGTIERHAAAREICWT